MCVCACACMPVCVWPMHAHVCSRVPVHACVRVCECAHACVRAHQKRCGVCAHSHQRTSPTFPSLIPCPLSHHACHPLSNSSRVRGSICTSQPCSPSSRKEHRSTGSVHQPALRCSEPSHVHSQRAKPSWHEAHTNRSHAPFVLAPRILR